MTEEQGKELLRLSLECYRSLKRKYPVRGFWTQEFQEWRKFLQNISGEDVAAWDREAIDGIVRAAPPSEG